MPPALQEQYTTLQRQLAEQAAMSATLADQLQKLQSLVPPALTAQQQQQERPQGSPERRRDPTQESASQPGSPRVGGGVTFQQTQTQLLRNHAAMEQMPMSATGAELPPELAATLAALAASSSPLPPGSLRALEQQLVAQAMEKEAVERALLQEQSEVRLLQQELGVMAQVADALKESQSQLQEARLAVAHQQQELQDWEQQLEASREQASELLAELAAEKERSVSQVATIASYFEQQFEEARAAVVSELREQHRTGAVAALAGDAGSSKGLGSGSTAAQLEAWFSRLPEALRADIEAQIATGRASPASAIAALQANNEALRLLERGVSTRSDTASPLSPGRSQLRAVTEAEHAAQMAILRADHTMQVGLLRARHSAQLEALAAEKAAQPVELREKHAAKLAALRTMQEEQMEELRAEHEAQMEVLAAERATQPEAMRAEHASQLAALRADHARQMEALRSEHAKEVGVLLSERAVLPEAMRAAHAAQLEAVRSEHAARLGLLRADHVTQMETMRASHTAQLQTLLSERATQPDVLRAEHAAQLEAMRAEHAKQIDAMRAEHTKQVEVLAAERAAAAAAAAQQASQPEALRAEHAKQMENMRAEMTAQIESLLSERISASQSLRDEYASQLEAVRASHASQLASQSMEHARQIEAMRAEHSKQMERLLAETAAQPEVLRAGYSTQVLALRAEHAMQVEALRSEHAGALAEKERQRAAAAAAHEQQLQALRAEQQQRLEELAAQARTRLQRQEAEHRAAMAEQAQEQDAQLAQHTRRLDELLIRQRKQLDELSESNSRQLEEVRRQGERLLAEVRAEAARAAEEADAAQEATLAALEGRLRAAEAAEAAALVAKREGEAARAALQAQLDEALTALGRERVASSELRGLNQSLEVAELEVRRRMEKLMAPQDLGLRLKMEMDRLGSRFLLRRVLGHWASNARLSRRQKDQLAVVSGLCRRRVCSHALRHWRTAMLRTRVLRDLGRTRELVLLRRVLVSLKAQVLQRRRKSQAASVAFAHWSVRQLSRCFEAWRQLHRMYTRAASYSDSAALRAAIEHHSCLMLRAALEAWHRHVYQTQLPKMQRRRRAAHVYRRRLLRHAMAGFAQQAERRALKRSQLARGIRRHRLSVLNRAVVCWLRFLDGTRRKRSQLGMADVQWGHAVVQRWRRAAARSRALRVGLAALQASSGTRRLRACMARWRAFLLRWRQSALASRLACEHHRGALLWRCMSSWLHLAQQSAVRQLHITGMREYQRMMQAAMRWQRLVELGRRQEAVVDRAVRLYRHRVLAATQRAVLRHWWAAVEGRRGLMRSAALSFVHAFLAIWRRRVLVAWHGEARRAAVARGLRVAMELRSALESNEASMRQVSARLLAMGEESAALTEQLKGAHTEVLILRQELSDNEKQLAETLEALSNAEKELEARGISLAARAEKVAGLESERDMLLDRVHTLRQQVAAGEVSVASLQEQAASLQRSLAAAQGSMRELGMKVQQQAAQYEEQLLAARDEASLARREASSLAATASRLEQQAADGEAQLRAVRTGHEALVASLRQELRARDAHIMALGQSQQQQRDAGAAASRPATAAAGGGRPPSPAFSHRPFSARDAPPRAASGRTRSAAGAQELADVEYRGGPMGFNEEGAGGDVEREDAEGWELQRRDGGTRLRPLFEPSAPGPAASAGLSGQPWSSASSQRGGRLVPTAGVPPRPSLMTHSLQQNRAPAVAPPPQSPLWPQSHAEEESATEAPPAAENPGMRARSPRLRFANDAATEAEAAAETVVAAAATCTDGSAEWPADMAAAGSAHGGDPTHGDEEDLPPPPPHTNGTSGAFRRLQAAEAALRATEEEFQRRRCHILGLDMPSPMTDETAAASAAAGAAALQPQRSLSPRLLAGGAHRRAVAGAGVPPRPQLRPEQWSVPGSSADLGAHANASVSFTGSGVLAGGRALRHSASEVLDSSLQAAREHMEELSPGGLQSCSSDGPSWPREQALHPPPPLPRQPQRRRNATTDPGDAETVNGAVGGMSGVVSDGGAPHAPQLRSAELDDLTAGIVGTLSNLREALRSQKARPAQAPLLPQRPGPLPLQAPSAQGAVGAQPATSSGGEGVAGWHRTMTFGPTAPFTGSPKSMGSEAGGSRSYSMSGGDGGEAIEATLRDLLRATAPPSLPSGTAASRSLSSQQRQSGPDRRMSAESASGVFSEASRMAEASELFSRSLVSLLGSAAADAAASTAGDTRIRPDPPRSGSSPSSVLAWLRDSAPADEGDGDLRQLSDLALGLSRGSPRAGTSAAASASAARPPGGQARLVAATVPFPERGHELYTRVGAHVASLVEEGLVEAAGRALLRRTVDTMLGAEEDYVTIDGDAR